MQYLTIWDLVLTPVYLLPLIYIAKRYRDKNLPVGSPLRKYYLPGLYLKFGGAIFIGLIYQFYYNGGDTFNYLYHAQVINSALDDSVLTWFDLLLRRSPDLNPSVYQYSSQMFWYADPPSYTVGAIAAVLGIFNGTTYMPIALLFAFISYSGIWAMYRTFVKLYPSLHKPLAIAFLYIPSTFVWGSSIFKDTICMFSLGWMTYCTFRIVIDRKFSARNFFLLALSFYLLVVIKVYIILAFLPALSLWLLMTHSKKISSVGLRWVVNIFLIGITVGGLAFFAQRYASELNEYSLENIGKKAKKTQEWITHVSEAQEGSVYNIGTLDGTVGGMLSKFPQAVNVTLYRPYLWESRKPIILLSALEATAFLVLTLMVFYRRGIGNTFRQIFRDPNLLFFFIFTLIFAFAVGISTGNFGSLSRYKIPCMPFFASLLLILYYQYKPSAKTAKPILHEKKPLPRLA
ncbi:MAG TPA: hypothetical protein VFR58_14870 [Flavisolibacter sp.]|nr:hypothetical protein [Flavisolibacter sp.]